MPILCCAVVDTPETLAISDKPLAVAHTKIVVGKLRGSRFQIARGESIEIRNLGERIEISDEDGRALHFTPGEFQSLSRLCAVWRAVRVEFAAKVGSGKRWKWYPAPPLTYAAAGFRSVRTLPMNDPEVDLIHDRFREPRIVPSKQRIRGIAVEHDIVTRGDQRIGFVARDPDGNSTVITRRHVFVSYKKDGALSIANLVDKLDHEPSMIGHGGIALDWIGVAVVEAAASQRRRSR